MEETVVLKLQTYLNTQARIEYLTKQVEKAVASATEANLKLTKLKPLIDRAFERCQRGDYSSFYNYLLEEEIRPLGLEEEAQKWLIAKRKVYEKEQAKIKAQKLAEAKQALEDAETVRVIDEELAGK